MAEAPVKILIVDDEDLARQKIARYLRELEAEVEVKEASNGLEAVALVQDFAPDVLFLDIQMPGLNGFDVLAHFKERPFAVVFQTAFDEFAIKAFEENACDYLLKPFTRERFAKAFARARQAGLSKQAEEGLLKALGEGQRFLEHLCVDDRGVRLLVDIDTVDALVSRDHYTCIHAGPKEYLIDLSLQKLASRLDPHSFVRLHRAALARVKAIKMVTKGDDPTVELHSGLKIAVSRRQRGPLLDRLKIS